jgi:putative tricarboxylic transport membrane protein
VPEVGHGDDATPNAPYNEYERSLMQLSDRVTGLFLVGLGSAASYGGWLLPPVPGQLVGPDVFPMVVGFGLIICGLLIILGIGHSFEEEPELEALPPAEEGSSPAEHPAWLRGLRALVPPGLLVFYVYAVDRLGFLLTAAIIILTTSLTLGARLRLAAPLAILAPLAVHLVFSKLLRVPLPAGWIPSPW